MKKIMNCVYENELARFWVLDQTNPIKDLKLCYQDNNQGQCNKLGKKAS